MDPERYNKNNYSRKKHPFRMKLVLLFFFLLVLGIIYVTTIYEGGITGSIIKNANENNSVFISLETNIPEIKLKGDYKKIELDVSSKQDFVLEDKKIPLDKISNILTLSEFSGEILFDERAVKLLDGKISEIYVNGILIKDEKDRKMNILSSNLDYNSIEFKEDIFIEELNFVSSGKVNIEKNTIILDKDNLFVKNLFGEFLVKEKKLYFNGLARILEIGGKNKKISISK